MEFIFDEEVDEVGSDIEAYCPKCKADTSHTVITKYEDEIRRVQCSPCGDVHSYRKPRGEVDEDVPEPVAAKKRATAKKPTWDEARGRVGEKALANARVYTIRDTYKEGDLVSHPKFGVGFVTEISENKVEVTFQDERRVLVHNRPDLAARMPAIAPVPEPREPEKRGKGKRAAAEKKKPEPVVVTPEPKAAKAAGAKAGSVEAAAARKKPATKPVTPAKPVKVKAAKPAKPSKPAKPAKPVKPTKAAKPTKPAKPSGAKKPAKAATKAKGASRSAAARAARKIRKAAAAKPKTAARAARPRARAKK